MSGNAIEPHAPRSGWTDERVEAVVGRILQSGVLLAALVTAFGGAMILMHYGRNPADFHRFAGESDSEHHGG